MKMDRQKVEKQLMQYIVEQRLDGDASGVDGSTPLLAWGLLDSLSVVDLLSFIEDEFDVAVPPELVTASNLETLHAISQLVVDISATSTAQPAS
jgi:acyl carrier protein